MCPHDTPPAHEMYVSPHFTAPKVSPGTFDDWVDVFEDRVAGWWLDHAGRLGLSNKDAAFVITYIAVGLIEPYEVFCTGRDSKGKSESFFCSGFKRIFCNTSPPQSAETLDRAARRIYRWVRCGLLHSAMPRGPVHFAPSGQAITFWGDETDPAQEILIDPRGFVEAVRAAHIEFIARLRNPDDVDAAGLRARFTSAWHLMHAKR